jgi:membrane-bound lytic murein transglycosylase B
MKRWIALPCLFWATALCAAPDATTPDSDYAARTDVQAFIIDMSARHGFAAEALTQLFMQVRRQDSVLRAIAPVPRGVRSWENYRANFVNPGRIERGALFLSEHRAILERAEAQFGVPAEIIVAIIGVETQYGRNMGGYRVVDALTTLAFDYPRRGDYFREELEQLLLYARESERAPESYLGSYAGAIGIPQFMPGSIRRFAVDFDDNGRRELRTSVADAIGSVGHFLQMHGWRAGETIAVAARPEGENFRALIDGGVLPDRDIAALRAAGVAVDPAIDDAMPAVLIELDSPAGAEYLVGLQNFYVLTRYNRSSFYAAAVWSLAQAIRNGS